MADTPLIISAEVLGLDSFKSLDKTIEAIDSSATELNSTFGKTDKALASSSKAAANTQRSMRSLERGASSLRDKMDRATTSFRDMGELGGPLADKLDQIGVVMSGPLGAAIAGLVVGIGAAKLAFIGLSKAVEFTTEAVKKFIESDKEAQLEAKKLTQSFDRLTIAFGSAVVGGDNVNDVLRKMALEMDKTTEEIEENAQNINDVFSFLVKALSQTAEKVVNFFSMPVIGFVFLLESIGNLMKLILREVAFTLRFLAESSAKLADMLGLDVKAVEGLVDALKDLEDGFDARINLDWAESAESVRSKFQSIMEFSRDLVDTTGKPQKFQIGLSLDRAQIERGLGWVQDKAEETGRQVQDWLSFPAPKRGRAPGRTTKAEPTLREVGVSAADEIWPGWRSLPTGLEEAQVEALPAIETTTRAVRTQSEAVDDLGSNWDKLIDISKDFAAALLSVSASMVGGFAAGVGTLSELGDAILDTFADLASNIGDFFLKWGMLEVLVNPALGAAMIAGAIGLKAFGGFLAGKGSGNRGSGRGGGGASAQADVNRQMARSLTPETDSGPRTIEVSVQIGTKQIEPEIVSIMGQATRLNRLAYQGG